MEFVELYCELRFGDFWLYQGFLNCEVGDP